MVVLDISLPTGFTPENSDLEMVIRQPSGIATMNELTQRTDHNFTPATTKRADWSIRLQTLYTKCLSTLHEVLYKNTVMSQFKRLKQGRKTFYVKKKKKERIFFFKS